MQVLVCRDSGGERIAQVLVHVLGLEWGSMMSHHLYLCNCPTDKVIQGIVRSETAVKFGIQYLADLIFDVSFDLYRRWWGLLVEWEWVGCGGL